MKLARYRKQPRFTGLICKECGIGKVLARYRKKLRPIHKCNHCQAPYCTVFGPASEYVPTWRKT